MSTTCTVTATICDPSQTNLLGSAFVRFRLRNFQGFVPTVQTSNVICETQIDAVPNPAGVISQVLTCNTAIYPANTWYTVEFWNQGRPTSSGNYIFNGNTSLNTAATINPAPAPQGPSSIIFENNGALNSSQTLLNLESTDSSVIITDTGAGTINLQAAANGASFTTAGQGWFFGAESFSQLSDSGSAFGAVGNKIYAVQLRLQSAYKISALAAYVITGAGSGYGCCALYTANGLTKIIDPGANAFDTHTASQTLRNVTITPVTVPAGVYWFLYGSTDGSGSCVAHAALTGAPLLFCADSVTRVATSSFTIVAGAMPATVGTLTPYSFTGSDLVTPPAVIFMV